MARKDGAGGARLRLTTALVTLVTALVLPLVANVSTAKAAGVAFAKGDVLGAVGNGSVKHFDPSGTLLDTLVGAPSIFTAGMAFDSDGNLYTSGFDGQAVSKFDTFGNFLGTFGTGYDADPESITFDAAGNVYVGQADGTGAVLKFDASGNPLAQYGVARDDRGSDWIDLASDQCTLFYTSEGTLVKRFNVCTNAQLPDFATLPSGSAFALRIRPSGEVLVAATNAVYRLDATGALVQTYTIPNPITLFALNLDPDGTSFWTGDLSSGDIFKVDIVTGNILETFNAASFTALGGLAVVGEIRVGSVNLSVTKGGTGTGTVTSNPTGIDCGTTCSADYGSGQVVTLTATADAGSTFAGWGGDGASCGTSATCQVTMDAPKSLSATFDVGPRTLTVTKAGSGSGTVTSSPAGIDCGSTCSADFTSGQVVTLTATADAGSTFTGWGGDCTGSGPCVVTMDQDRAVTATFDIAPATPRVLKQDAVASLQALLPTGDEQADRKIQRAIHEINETLEPQLWLDDSHLADKGRRVFHEEKEAARALTRILNPPTIVASVLDSLVAADQALARTAIDEATASGGDPGILAEAENQMQKAADELANGHVPESIEHYGRAWKKAQEA